MNELVKITEENGKKAVSAKELYDNLGFAPQHWAQWYKKNIINNNFSIENEDYIKLPLSGRTPDFALSIEFAKKLSMLARTEQGEKIRSYFIEMENVALKQSIPSHNERMDRLEKMVENLIQLTTNVLSQPKQLEIKQDYLSILAFCRLYNRPIEFSEAIQKGKLAVKLSKEQGLEVRKVRDERYGYVGSYKESILKAAFSL